MLTGAESVFPVPAQSVESVDGVVISGRYDEPDAWSCSGISTVIFIEVELEGPISTTAPGSTLSSTEDVTDSGVSSASSAVFRFVQGQRSDLSYA